MSHVDSIACHDCGLLQHAHPLAHGERARCQRCAAALYAGRRGGLERGLALLLASLVLLVLANVYPFMSLGIEGRVQGATLFTGVSTLWDQDEQGLALLVFAASIGVPAVRMLLLSYVIARVRGGSQAAHLGRTFRYANALAPWSMLEIYVLGVLVALVKLSEMAHVSLGPAFYAFVALIVTSAAATACLDSRAVWARIPVRT